LSRNRVGGREYELRLDIYVYPDWGWEHGKGDKFGALMSSTRYKLSDP